MSDDVQEARDDEAAAVNEPPRQAAHEAQVQAEQLVRDAVAAIKPLLEPQCRADGLALDGLLVLASQAISMKRIADALTALVAARVSRSDA